MNSSGIKRGLAVSAISALALAGLAIAPAQAQTIQQGEDVVVDLYSVDTGGIGIRNDGNNTTVTLMAGSNNANVNSFSFYYLKGATEVLITDVANINGLGTTQWTPPVGAELAAITGVRVKAFNAANVQVGANTDNAIAAPNAVGTNDVIGLTGPANSPLGVYRGQVIISGKATDPANTFVNVEGPGASDGAVAVVATGAADGIGTPVAGLAPISAANNSADALDSVIARAYVPGESDDEQVYELYNQSINTVTATVAPGYNANTFGPATETRYVVKALDQQNKPIGGVDVYQSNIAGVATAGIGRTPANAAYATQQTDVLGQSVVRINEADIDTAADADPAVGIGATYVVVDYDEDGVYDLGLDQIFKLSISNLPLAPASIDIASSKGFALDDDETSNLTITVKDASNSVVPNAAVTVTVAKDVADNTPVDSTTNLGVFNTDADGKIVIPNVNLTENNNKVATTVTATTAGVVKTQAFETDQAAVVWDSANNLQALANTSVTAGGKLALPSGTVLPGRTVGIQLARAAGDADPVQAGVQAANASFAPQAEQPAGTIRGGDLIADATTSATGTFSVKITDPATPVANEVGDSLTAGMTPPALLADSIATIGLDFLRSLDPTKVAVNSVTPLLGAATPGRPVNVNYTVTNADGIILTGASVKVDVNNDAFLTPASTTAANLTSVAAGGLYGKFVNSGTSTTTPLGGNATGNATVAIERSAGFDDDFANTVTATITAGAASTTATIPFTTSAAQALNLGDVAISVSEETVPDTEAPIQTREIVFYDVTAKDQFGNLSREPVTVDDAGNPNAGFNTGIPALFVGGPQTPATGFTVPTVQPNGVATFYATATAATTQNITATVNGLTNTASATDQNLVLAGVQVNTTAGVSNKALTDTLTWYVIDFANATYDLDLSVEVTGFEGIQSGQALNSGTCDVAAAGMTITPEREEAVDFSEPYFDATQALLTTDESIDSLEALDGMTLGVMSGTTGELYAEDNAPEGVEIKSFEDLGLQTRAVQGGQVDAIIQDNGPLLDLAKENDDLFVTAEFDTGESYGFAVRKDQNDPLLESIDTVVSDARDDGSYDEIYEKWFGQAPTDAR